MKKIGTIATISGIGLLLIACSGNKMLLTKADDLRLQSLNDLPFKSGFKFIKQNFKFYDLKYVTKNYVMPSGMTTCKFFKNNMQFPTEMSGLFEYIDINYKDTQVTGYIGDGYYQGKNIGNIRAFTIRGMTDKSYIVNCAVKLRPNDNFKKAGSALYALGIKTASENKLNKKK